MRFLASLALLAVTVLATSNSRTAVAEQVDPRQIPLVDQTGHGFRLMDLAGTPTVVTFVAARCTDACPLANVAFARALMQLRADHVRSRLLTITLDPGHDTPAVMARLARPFGASRDDWRFATGKSGDVHRLMQSFGVEEEADAHGIPEAHSSFVYVLDRDVRLKRTLLLSTALTGDIEDSLHAGRSS